MTDERLHQIRKILDLGLTIHPDSPVIKALKELYDCYFEVRDAALTIQQQGQHEWFRKMGAAQQLGGAHGQQGYPYFQWPGQGK